MPDPTNPAAPCGDPHDMLDTLAHYALAECARRGKGHAGGVEQAIDKLRELLNERCAPMPPPNQPAAPAVDPREICAKAAIGADVLPAMNLATMFGPTEHAIVFRDQQAFNVWIRHVAKAVELAREDCAAAIRALPPFAAQQPSFDMLAHLRRQREWSERTFGPGARTAGVIDHIRKELREIEADPADVSEWIDVAILALDGAWRAGFQPQQIIDALVAKQAKNEARQWPDWRTAPADKAIEHVKPAQQPSEAVLRLCRAARNCMRTVERESRDEYDALRSALASVDAEGGR